MLFNLFGNSKEESPERKFTDKVYISTEAKMNACLQLFREQPATVFIAWFTTTAKNFENFFQQHREDTSCIIEARMIHTGKLSNHVPVFIEHYPLHEKELALIENWEQKKITIYSAMDEPLFKHLGSDKMIPLIKLLGMNENESIEHSYVTQSIIKGQQKIAGKVTIEQSANSQEEWMGRNLKD